MKALTFLAVALYGVVLFAGNPPLLTLPQIEEVSLSKEEGTQVKHLLIHTCESTEPVSLEIYRLDANLMQLIPLEFEELKTTPLNKEVVLKEIFDTEKAEILVLLRARGSIVSLFLVK